MIKFPDISKLKGRIISSKINESELFQYILWTGHLKEVDGNIKLNESLKELMFATYLAYFFNARMNRIKKDLLLEEKYMFFKFGDITLFAGNLSGFSLFPMRSLIEEKTIPSKIFDSREDHQCLAKYFFLYNMTKNGIYGGSIKHAEIIKKVPSCKNDRCEVDAKELLKIINSGLPEKDLGTIFDCKIMNLEVAFLDLNFLIYDDAEYYKENHDLEKTFIEMLCIYLGTKYDFDAFYCGAELLEPYLSNEMDLVFQKGQNTLVIEVSSKSVVSGNYLRNKLINFHYLRSQFSDKIRLVVAFSGKTESNDASKEIKHIEAHKDKIKIIKIREKYYCPSKDEWKNNGFENMRSMFNDLIDDIEKEIQIFIS